MSGLTIGSKVHHLCEYPDCPIYGKVLAIKRDTNMMTMDGEIFDFWAYVEWEPVKGEITSIPSGYRTWVPLARLEPAK